MSLSHRKQDSSGDTVGYLKNVWNSVKSNGGNTLSKATNVATLKYLSNARGCEEEEEDKLDQVRKRSIGKLSKSPTRKTIFGGPLQNSDETVNMDLSKSKDFEVRQAHPTSALSNTKKLNHPAVHSQNRFVEIEDFNKTETSREEGPTREELLTTIEVMKLRIEHMMVDLAKKDAEVANLKRKLKEHRKLAKGLEVLDTDPLDMAIENSRLVANVNRLQELISGTKESKEPSVISLLYPPHSLAFVGGDAENLLPNATGGSKQCNHHVGTSKPLRKCCNKLNQPVAPTVPTFDYDELAKWIPKQAHKLMKEIVGELGLSSSKEKLIKNFILALNQSFIHREKEALANCANLCKREIKYLQKCYIDAPIHIKNQPGSSKKKSDREAFMEGASWILAKVQADFNKIRHTIGGVLKDLTASPSIIVKAMVFASEGLTKLNEKMVRYEKHITEQIVNEHDRSPNKRQKSKDQARGKSKHRPAEYDIAQAEYEAREAYDTHDDNEDSDELVSLDSL